MRIIFFIVLLSSSASVLSQDLVNRNLFGFRMSTSFIFFELEDTSFTNKVVGLKPQVLSFPGGLGNFYHLHAPGYGLDVEDFRKYHKKSKVKTAQTLKKISFKKGHDDNYIYDFIQIAKLTKSKVIFNANIISSTAIEALEIINIFLEHELEVIGIELGGELSNRSYSHFMTIEKYIEISEKYAKQLRKVYKDIPISVVAAPINRNSKRLDDWNNKLSDTDFYDAIVVHPYAKIVKGKDLDGQMLTVIPEGVGEKETYSIYKTRAIEYITKSFKKEMRTYNSIFKDKEIWLTEWNLQMSPVTGNSLLQGIFVSNQLLELAATSSDRNIMITTFHNLAGRTLSGAMLMSKDDKMLINTSYYSMKIVKDLFQDSVFLKDRKVFIDECIQYCFINTEKNELLFYWVNWSDKAVVVNCDDIRDAEKYELFGDELFIKNNEKEKVHYIKSQEINKEIILKPYSVTFIKQSNK